LGVLATTILQEVARQARKLYNYIIQARAFFPLRGTILNTRRRVAMVVC
jgi:hypothetical protein